ncbi:MYO2 [Symbiodinium sp. CCMP2456]|nr:MYO2 [Symbiodinium sp. CCMP2456]
MEGAKVYVQDARGSWQRGTVQAALGSGRYKVALQGWEEDELQTSQTTEVDASNMEGGMLPFQNADMPNNGFPVGPSLRFVLEHTATAWSISEDMTTLDHLHEPALLHNLRRRFFSQVGPRKFR